MTRSSSPAAASLRPAPTRFARQSVLPRPGGARQSRTPPSELSDPICIAVIGDRHEDFPPQESIEHALRHAAAPLGAAVGVTWFPTPSLVDDAASSLAGFDAVWCAPGGPYRNLDGALEGIRVARETGRPFLGTCAGFQHGVIEFARNVLAITDAHHAEYEGTPPSSPLLIDELLCSLVGRTMAVRLVDDAARALYGADEATEQYYCRFGLDERYTDSLATAGLRVAGVDAADGATRLMRLADHPFFYLTLFVPQTASRPDRPHPLVVGYVTAALHVASAGHR
jgi:CTP synthase (UTP-ammonia lyase)